MNRLIAEFQRLAWRGYIRARARAPELRQLSWEATGRCNLACAHCAALSGPAVDPARELTTQEARDLFSAVAADFPPDRLSIGITGGEPLLRSDLFTILEHLNRLGLAWGLITNGLLLDDAMLDRLAAAGIGSLSISLDGPPEFHERLRGPGTYAPVLDAVRRAAAHPGVPLLEVGSVLTAGLAPELPGFAELLAGLGVGQWRLLPLAHQGRARDCPGFCAPAAELRASLAWIRDYRGQADKDAMQVTFDESGYLGREWERRVREVPFFCGSGIVGAHITATGEVTGCPFVGPAFSQGNIRARPFREIWEQEFRVYRDRDWTRCGDCAGCGEYRDCRGGCLMNWESPTAAGTSRCLYRNLQDGDG